jgi:hypothetical protein
MRARPGLASAVLQHEVRPARADVENPSSAPAQEFAFERPPRTRGTEVETGSQRVRLTKPSPRSTVGDVAKAARHQAGVGGLIGPVDGLRRQPPLSERVLAVDPSWIEIAERRRPIDVWRLAICRVGASELALQGADQVV